MVFCFGFWVGGRAGVFHGIDGCVSVRHFERHKHEKGINIPLLIV